MATVIVRFDGGPAHDLVRELPAGPDGQPPERWTLRHPGTGPAPAGGGTDHLYERTHRDGHGRWTMRFVRSDPLGVTE